ncbi:MAG: 6-phosphogluconolactonase [Bacteroidota bacterium]|nr:6-phosphogluconolactonase [Bacteroidota bacterium]
MNSNLHIYDTPQDTARAVAELIRVKAKEKNKQSLPLNMALSGGNTPKLLFNLLANEYVDTIPWHFVRLFWVDERCVPPTHVQSNYGMTYENLLKSVPIHDSNVFPIQGEIDPNKEAKRYQNTLETQLPLYDGFPKFDLILLGMGDDGHTASIFPTDLSLLYSDQFVAVSSHPVSDQKRITLTGQVINRADEVVFLVTGGSKANVLKQIIRKEEDFASYPATYIHALSGPAHFYLDQEAAGKL